jgi:hypothetical protein
MEAEAVKSVEGRGETCIGGAHHARKGIFKGSAGRTAKVDGTEKGQAAEEFLHNLIGNVDFDVLLDKEFSELWRQL